MSFLGEAAFHQPPQGPCGIDATLHQRLDLFGHRQRPAAAGSQGTEAGAGGDTLDGALDLLGQGAGVLARRHEPSVGRVRLLTVLEAPPGARKVPTRQQLAALGLDPVTPLGALDDATAAMVAERFPVLAP